MGCWLFYWFAVLKSFSVSVHNETPDPVGVLAVALGGNLTWSCYELQSNMSVIKCGSMP